MHVPRLLQPEHKCELSLVSLDPPPPRPRQFREVCPLGGRHPRRPLRERGGIYGRAREYRLQDGPRQLIARAAVVLVDHDNGRDLRGWNEDELDLGPRHTSPMTD